MRHIGLHLRVRDSLREAAERAVALKLPIFQCFFIEQQSRALIAIDDRLEKQFAQWRADTFDALFVHGSYYINLATRKYDAVRFLKRELALAKRLSCTHLVLHPGAASGSDKQGGIERLARSLNAVLKHEHDVQIVLENTTHGKLSVGSDITDFAQLREKLDHPERVSFCIDTAHAHCYGYDLGSTRARAEFIQLVDQAIGISNISLIHLNDTDQQCGSRIDKHAAIGAGMIGEEALKQFALHPRLASIPLILELPVLPEPQEDAMLQKIREWHR